MFEEEQLKENNGSWLAKEGRLKPRQNKKGQMLVGMLDFLIFFFQQLADLN